jgi:hypothetical protein
MSPIRARIGRAGMQLSLYGFGTSVWVYDAVRLAQALHL